MNIQHITLAFLLSVGCLSAQAQQGNESAPPTPIRMVTESSRPANQINSVFPFDIELKDSNGVAINSAKLFKKSAKPTVLMFWLTTCGPCKLELAAISQKFESWKKEMDFDFYAISTDFSDRTEQFYNRVKTSKWPFPAYHDFNREFKLVMPGGLNGLPQIFVLDASGAVQYHSRRYMPGDEDKLWEAIKLLKK
jgi:thiol-disulfide isomerase/thioredoxin